MLLPVWLDNLVAYSIQITILAAAGTLLASLFRLRVPRVSLIYWQVLLLACLLLPVLQNWKRPVQIETSEVSQAAYYRPAGEAIAVETVSSFSLPSETIGLAIIAGACLRMIWLAFGCFRLRNFWRHSRFLSGIPPIGKSLLSRIGAHASFYLSDKIDSPATFGLIHPKVILPESFTGMSEACRESIVCHELLHVRRRDWAVMLVEEIIRSVYWFHPAVWWLLGRIHLAREQAIDHEVVRLTGSRQPYLDSLLEIARSLVRPKAVPAPLLLKERHLVQRVALLLKEASMNRIRLGVSLAAIALLLAGTVHFAAAWFPLTGVPVIVQEEANDAESRASHQPPIRVGSKVMESKLTRKVNPVYPELAKRARISGEVILTVNINEEGSVSQVQVVSGHPLLTDATEDAVKQWKYNPTLLNGKPVPAITTVTVVFVLKGTEAITGSGSDAPEWSPEEYKNITIAVPGAVVAGKANGEKSTAVEGGAYQPPPVRADNDAMKPRITRKVEPVYPESAKQEGVEGNVTLTFTVNEEGSVSDVQHVSGHPLLTDAAVEAVKQWKYRPTLLNGKPVPVMATVTVVFALKRDKPDHGSELNSPETTRVPEH